MVWMDQYAQAGTISEQEGESVLRLPASTGSDLLHELQ